MRKQTIFESDDINVRKFQSLATVHRDERDGVAFVFFLVFAVAVERGVFEKFFQSFGQRRVRRRTAVECRNNFSQVADAVIAVFFIFFRAAQFVEVTNFVEKFVRPKL